MPSGTTKIENSWNQLFDKYDILSRVNADGSFRITSTQINEFQNVYWNGFGDPPSLTYRADFNDIEYNRERQRTHALIKGRFAGGNLGWIVPEDLELFAAVFIKPLDRLAP